jgi:hypothetical protein
LTRPSCFRWSNIDSAEPIDYRRRPPPTIPPVFGINVDPLGDVLMKALPEGLAALSAPADTLPAPLLMAPFPTPIVMPVVAPGVENAWGTNAAAFGTGSMVARTNPATVAAIKAFDISDLLSTRRDKYFAGGMLGHYINLIAVAGSVICA